MEKPECKVDFDNHNLLMSDEKCGDCPYKYECRYMAMAMDEVVYG